jgi:hypothetical protein
MPLWAWGGLAVAWAAAFVATVWKGCQGGPLWASRRRIGRDEDTNCLEVRGGVLVFDGRSDPGGGWVDPDSVARTLLIRLLTPDQEQQYRGNRGFFVETARARYHIREGERVAVTFPEFSITVCVVFDGEYLPDADRLIAILLMIRTEEELFLERFVWPVKRRREEAEAAYLEAARRNQTIGDPTRATTICIQSSDDLSLYAGDCLKLLPGPRDCGV